MFVKCSTNQNNSEYRRCKIKIIPNIKGVKIKTNTILEGVIGFDKVQNDIVLNENVIWISLDT